MLDRLNEELTETIKARMKEEINDYFTDYKNKCLANLNNEIESKRNKTVNDILEGIKVYIDNNSPYDGPNTYNINIRLENKIVLKEN